MENRVTPIFKAYLLKSLFLVLTNLSSSYLLLQLYLKYNFQSEARLQLILLQLRLIPHFPVHCRPIFFQTWVLLSSMVFLTSMMSSFAFRLVSLVCIYVLYIVRASNAITSTPPNNRMYSAAPCPEFSLINVSIFFIFFTMYYMIFSIILILLFN